MSEKLLVNVIIRYAKTYIRLIFGAATGEAISEDACFCVSVVVEWVWMLGRFRNLWYSPFTISNFLKL